MQACWCSLAGTRACENCPNNYNYSEYKFPTIQQAVQMEIQTNNSKKELENTFEIVKRSKREINGTD